VSTTDRPATHTTKIIISLIILTINFAQKGDILLKVLVLNASYPQILTIENSFSLIYPEITHI